MRKRGRLDGAGFLNCEHVHDIPEPIAARCLDHEYHTPRGNSNKTTHRVVMSVARPVSPKYILSVTGKIYAGYACGLEKSHNDDRLVLTFSKFMATVIAPAPRRKSLAMATQSLPAIATTEPPL